MLFCRRARASREGKDKKINRSMRQRLAAGTTHHPKPDVDAPALGPAPDAVRGPQAPGHVPVGAPAQDAESASIRSNRVMDSLRRIRAIPIPAPFLDIACHVVETPGVRLFLATGAGRARLAFSSTTHSPLTRSPHPHRTSALWCQPVQHIPIPPQSAGGSRSRLCSQRTCAPSI